ncbi:MAG TPA: DUF3261 domain-containing protein [Candidatus Anaerobiospirillum stercoravium]|nr:DUF3261 domain-containing protein [Candidatus Anaerobiospirillum stercoravium]
MRKLSAIICAVTCAATLALVGCATTQQVSQQVSQQVHLTPSHTVPLPKLSLNQPISREQLLTIKYQGREDQVLVLLEGQDQELKLSVLNPLGIRVVDASYDAGQLSVTTHIQIEQLPPAAQVLFDIFLGILPHDNIAAVLPEGFTLQDEARTRTIYDERGQVVEQVTFDPNHNATGIHHQVFGYIIEINDLN